MLQYGKTTNICHKQRVNIRINATEIKQCYHLLARYFSTVALYLRPTFYDLIREINMC